MAMKEMGVTEWRSSLGDLRQSSEVVVVHYRRRPAALMVPIPPEFWDGADAFVDQLLKLRDEQLQSTHDGWISRTREPLRLNVEEARRSSAKLFGYTMNNTPVILTFYAYDNSVMLPLPPDLSTADLKAVYSHFSDHIQ